MNAGQVTGVRFEPKTGIYDINISVSREYRQYVTTATTFWDVGGLEVKFDAAGFSMETPPLGSLISGGIAFDNPEDEAGEPAETGHLFKLYGSERESTLSENVITLKMKDAAGIKGGANPCDVYGASRRTGDRSCPLCRLQRDNCPCSPEQEI
ncbi:MAG: hypothetical protein LRY51_13330 [Geovibrio sp.]|nr:hypothetical protein [Geovibrio sp.]